MPNMKNGGGSIMLLERISSAVPEKPVSLWEGRWNKNKEEIMNENALNAEKAIRLGQRLTLKLDSGWRGKT